MNSKKIGLFFGVFVPNVTMMFGVILFLRLGLIVSHAGLPVTLATVFFGLVIMLITSASIASIVSNMEVGSGGVYYLVTRSLGLEIGGALGYAIYLSQLLSIALTTSGFAYTFIELFPQYNVIKVEFFTLGILAFLSSSSAKLALKFQGVILFVLIAALGAIFFGDANNLPEQEIVPPFYPNGHLSFWMAFALLYPALTGIEAGMALSGTLKDPSRSLAYGNAISLIFVALCYAGLMVYAHYFIPHDALISDPFAFVNYSSAGWLVTLGICAATLSSALGSLLGAPRILQSIANDGLTHSSLAKTYGPHQEPRWALFLTAGLALLITITTNIDQIIPILTMICLISYALLNVIAMLASLMNAPSWRPQFKVHFLISFAGAVLCFISMFMISAGWAITSLFLLLGFYLVLRRFEVKATFSDLRNSILFFLSRVALYRLANSMNHALTWHPIMLVLIKSASRHIELANLANSFARQSGLLTFATVVPESWSDPNKINATRSALESFYKKENIECLVEVHVSEDEHSGYVNLIKSYGMGQIQPNTIVLPISNEETSYELLEYIYNCYLMQKNILLYQDPALDSPIHTVKNRNRKRKNIDIWWNSNSRISFDLLIGLIYTLTNSPDWNKSKVKLKIMTASKNEQHAMKKYLNGFVKKSRLKIDVYVYLDVNTQSEFSGLKKYSQNSNLVVLPIEPLTENESFNDYANYLNDLFKQTEDLPSPCIYVSSFDKVDHRESYIYPVSE